MNDRRLAGCFATSGADGMRCAACGTQWDHDDPEPPPCRTGARGLVPLVVQGEPVVARQVLEVPVELPLELADRMHAALVAHVGATPMPLGYASNYLEAVDLVPAEARRGAMRAAWRVFLDEAGQ